MVNIPLSSQEEVTSPGNFSAPTPATPRTPATPGHRLNRTAPGGVSAHLPPLAAAWPKGEDFSSFDVISPQRPRTAPTDEPAFSERLSVPRHPVAPRPTTSHSPRSVAAIKGGLGPSAPAAHAMVLKQKQAFTKMQSQCESLMRKQVKMQSKMDVMEYETRCLRVGAIHPQVVVDQLDGHAADLEDENDDLLDKKKGLEEDKEELQKHIQALEEREAAVKRELAEARAQCAELRGEGTELREQMDEMRKQHMEEMAGASLPEEQQAAVNAALSDVFTALPPATEAPAPAPAADDPQHVELQKAIREAALKAAREGKSPDEVAEAAADAQALIERAQASSLVVRLREEEMGAPPQVLEAVDAAVRRAIASGATPTAVEAASEAAKAAALAGARPLEVEVAADSACEMCDDVGARSALVAGRAALHAVRTLACATDVAHVAAEAVSRGLGRSPSDDELSRAVEYAAAQAASGKPWDFIVERLKEGAARKSRTTSTIAPPTMNELVQRQEAVGLASTEAKRRFGNKHDCVAAAEAAVELVMARGGSSAEAAVAARSASLTIHLGLGQEAADVAVESAVMTYAQLTNDPAFEDHEPLSKAPPLERPKLLMQHSGTLPRRQSIPESIHVEDTLRAATDAAGEAAARAFTDGALKFESLRTGAALARWAIDSKDAADASDARDVVIRAASKASHKCSRDLAAACAASAAGEAFLAGHSSISVAAAADAAVEFVMAAECVDDEIQLHDAAMLAGVEAAEKAKSVVQAAEAAAKAAGKSPDDALRAAQAAMESGGGVMAAAAFAVGCETVEASTAALMAVKGAQMDNGEFDMSQVDVLVAAAIVATEQADAGATPQMATRAGASAAASVASGSTLEEVAAAARESIPEIPGWSLESWLASLSFDKLVSEAILKRVRDAVPAGQPISAYEQAFVAKLGEHGSTETIMALLKETPVLRMLAEAICGRAQELVAELEEARRERERADEEERRREEEARMIREQRMAMLGGTPSAKRRWARLNLHRTSLTENRPSAFGRMVTEAKKSAEEINAEAVKKGAFTLSYSTDASLYWNGLSRLTGPPGSQLEKPILEWMFDEHCNRIDSDETFEVGNYGTVTTSRAEWLFVVEPDEGLEKLGLDEWPGAEQARSRHDEPRPALPLSYFRAEWDGIDRRLVAAGEQPLSDPEFIALRLYTGPLFRKYNAVLRGKCGVKFLENVFNDVCLGNTYATTLHVLTAAILKLGKIVPADLVYRAPGGAMPKSFWHKSPEGCQGGLELAFMSTTTAKKEAMAYARRAPGMILFEVQQGFVARGASISWLSQYPNEEEILFPPLTALEVCGTKVEGAVLVVQLRPSMKAPESLKTGAKDIEDMKKSRAEEAAKLEEAHRNTELERKKSAQALAVKERQMHWKQSMMDVQLAASKRQAAKAQSKLATEKTASIASKLAGTADRTLKRELTTQLHHAEEELKESHTAIEAAEKKATAAKESEQRALKAKQDAEERLGQARLKLTAQYTQAQFLKGVMRAKEAAALRSSMDGSAGGMAPEAAAPSAPEREVVDYGPLGDIGADATVLRLKEVVGDPAQWAVRGIQPEDVDFIHVCFDKLISLCGASKKSRKAAAQAGVFEEVAQVMKKYEDDDGLLLKCLEVLSACAKKAESDKIQTEAAACIAPLVESMDNLLCNAYDVIQNMTRNHRENTIKLVRLGGRVEWLAADSNVVPPDQPQSPPKRTSRSESSLRQRRTSVSPDR